MSIVHHYACSSGDQVCRVQGYGREPDLYLPACHVLYLLHGLLSFCNAVQEVGPESTALISESSYSALAVSYYPHMLQR